MNVIELLQQEQEKPEVRVLRSGDTVRVHVRVVEGARERIQVFEGLVIAVSGRRGLGMNVTVRRITHGVGVERTFLVHSPRIDRIEVLRHGDVRRGKLYYLREKVGKRARIRERREPIGGVVVHRRADVLAEEASVAGEDVTAAVDGSEEAVASTDGDAVAEASAPATAAGTGGSAAGARRKKAAG